MVMGCGEWPSGVDGRPSATGGRVGHASKMSPCHPELDPPVVSVLLSVLSSVTIP